LKRDLEQKVPRPDFNIGTDPYHTPKELVYLSVAFFETAGHSLGIDWPYSGSIVPMEHYLKNKQVKSIMLEINRGLYLNEPSNEKSANYFEIKQVVEKYRIG
jgi:N-formylglutamate amidohydrolase